MTKRPTAAQLQEMTGCVCGGLRRAARAMTHIYDEALRPYGLRGSQLSILVAASTRETLFMAPLADVLEMDRTTLLRNLRPLVRRRLLEVTSSPDSRRKEIKVTAAGRALVARAYEPWRRAQARAQESLRDPVWVRRLGTIGELVRGGRD